jgi:putative phosphoribosyl transferase
VIFRNRREAGRDLAARLENLRDENPIVLALPRGGVPVAAEVAAALGAPLDVIVVRKLGLPGRPEFAFGALGEGGVRLIDPSIIARAGLSDDDVADVVNAEQEELDRRLQGYRGTVPSTVLRGRTVIIVDDGLATGATATAAVHVARARGAARIVLAAPVASPRTVEALSRVADAVVVVSAPEGFVAVGQWYDDFTQTCDAEVAALLATRARPQTSGRPIELDAAIPAGGTSLPGHLTVPEDAIGVVLFAHGSGSSRHSPRNQAMARAMYSHGIGALLFDLLTPEEAADRRNVFDVALLGDRLLAATRWLTVRSETASLPFGYLGASTGAAAALWAAGERGNQARAVVSRGGRPDLTGPRLSEVTCPTLMVVGGLDHQVLELNRAAAAQMRCRHVIEIVPGATHVFEEPGTLEQATALAIQWFEKYLPER